MTGSPLGYHLAVVSKKGLVEGEARKFRVSIRGRNFEGFVVRRGERYFAYRNLCQHLPIQLDNGEGDFFTFDKAYLQCHLHGAVYEIESGHCIAGPCQGATLQRLELDEEESRLVVRIPDKF